MSTTALSPRTRPRLTGTPPPTSTSSVLRPRRLTVAQERELESELRRELAAIDRRLASERQAEAAETCVAPAHDAAVATRRSKDTLARRDVVASALARLASGTYGTCSRCGERIPYGRLLVMPEATHCLRCSGRS